MLLLNTRTNKLTSVPYLLSVTLLLAALLPCYPAHAVSQFDDAALNCDDDAPKTIDVASNRDDGALKPNDAAPKSQ